MKPNHEGMSEGNAADRVVATTNTRFSGVVPSANEIVLADDEGFPVGTCLSVDARIATPDGEVRAADIRAGMTVWSKNAGGHSVAVAVARVNATLVARSHTMMRVALNDGRVVVASAGHPTESGVQLGAIAIAEWLDGAQVISAVRIPYARDRTIDLLPDSPTGMYWSDRVALGSTLRPPVPRVARFVNVVTVGGPLCGD